MPPMAKFMASVTEETLQVLSEEARSRGISVQELLRAVIIPDWVRAARNTTVFASPPVAESRAYMQRRVGRTPF